VYDSFLLAGLSFLFCLLPPFRLANVVFIVFAAVFLLQECFLLGWITHLHLEIVVNVLFLALCASIYIYAIAINKQYYLLFSIPFLSFITALLLGYIEANVYFKLIASVTGAFMQVLILARPEIVEKLPVVAKRFYLLMSIMVFFDLLATVFFKLNFN
ncbi:MAG TPA: hypothetical protein VD905_20070, partial [Flavobacteriales bacterium]|nr:hypothetical protein [Flavobacteriales bacterium]